MKPARSPPRARQTVPKPGSLELGGGPGPPGPAPSPAVCPATSEESLAEIAWCPEDGQGPIGLVAGAVLLGVRGPRG